MASVHQVYKMSRSLVLSDWLERGDGRGTPPSKYRARLVSLPFPRLSLASKAANAARIAPVQGKATGNVTHPVTPLR